MKEDQWSREVHEALRRYYRADELARHSAKEWPAVQALSRQDQPVVAAIRKVLDQALAELEQSLVDEPTLLRQHYLKQRSIEALAADYARDPSTLHRQRNRLLHELAVIVAQHNLDAARARLVNRFKVRHPIVGFEQLATELTARITDDSAPQVFILEGMGGLGKTTLASLIAQQCAASPAFVGVLWVSAKQIEFNVWAGQRQVIQNQALNPDDLLFSLARELQLEVPGDRATIQLEVRAHCQRAPYLIVFDNLESVADIAALAPLLEQLVGPSRILITTRDHAPDVLPTTLDWQHVALHELPASVSYALLRRAAEYTNAPALAAASEAELAQIYAVTGGNPLALWLVAGQARSLPWTTFINDLVVHQPRGSSAYELYDYLYRRSWQQLSDAAQLVLFAMHRCETGASPELLLTLSGLDEPTFRQAVRELQRHMLLVFDGQYAIHRLTFTFLRVVIAGWWEA